MSKLPTYEELIILVGQLQYRVAELEKLYLTLQQLGKDDKLRKHDKAILKDRLAKY